MFQINDDIIKEYSLFTLFVLMSSERLRAYACTTGFALKLFFLLETQRDPDVQRNTLDILCNLLNPQLNVWDTLPPPDIKYPKLLLCYLIHEYKELQILTVRLLEQLSQYHCSNFHQAMVDSKIVEKMFEILQVIHKICNRHSRNFGFRILKENFCTKALNTLH